MVVHFKTRSCSLILDVTVWLSGSGSLIKIGWMLDLDLELRKIEIVSHQTDSLDYNEKRQAPAVDRLMPEQFLFGLQPCLKMHSGAQS